LGIEDRKQARLKHQAKLICDFSEKYKRGGQFDDFFTEHNMGVPLALALDMGMVTGVQGIGEMHIEDTYEDMVVNIFGNDPSVRYDSIDQMVREVTLDDLGLTEDDAEDLGWTKEA
jgi:hypothetical protein